MIFDGCIGMRDRNFLKRRIARHAGCLEQQFKVHHIVDDHQEIAGFRIPDF